MGAAFRVTLVGFLRSPGGLLGGGFLYSLSVSLSYDVSECHLTKYSNITNEQTLQRECTSTKQIQFRSVVFK